MKIQFYLKREDTFLGYLNTPFSPNWSPNRTVAIPYLNRTRAYQGRGKVVSCVIWLSKGTVDYAYGYGSETSFGKANVYFLQVSNDFITKRKIIYLITLKRYFD